MDIGATGVDLANRDQPIAISQQPIAPTNNVVIPTGAEGPAFSQPATNSSLLSVSSVAKIFQLKAKS
jgi:hypothetical protein